MNMIDFLDRQVPDYYPSMYLDGYTPDQIYAEEAVLIQEPVAVGAELQTQTKNQDNTSYVKTVLNNIVFYGEASSEVSLEGVQSKKSRGNDPPSQYLVYP